MQIGFWVLNHFVNCIGFLANFFGELAVDFGAHQFLATLCTSEIIKTIKLIKHKKDREFDKLKGD